MDKNSRWVAINNFLRADAAFNCLAKMLIAEFLPFYFIIFIDL